MTVGVLLVTHSGIGTAMQQLAGQLLGRLPLALECLEVPFDADLDALLPDASRQLRRLDSGAGVLLLTDLYGASPSNFAARLGGLGVPTRRIAGLNLPMLLRTMNYADRDLAELADAAASGGRLGVVVNHA
jgi:mannose PTS system EIIA component